MKTLLLISCGLIYVASLFFPVFEPSEGDPTYILGLIALLFGWGNYPWFANPLLFASYIFLFKRRYSLAVLLSGSGVILGLSTLLMVEIPRDGSGQKTSIDGYGLAFYLWMSSLLLTFLGTLIYLIAGKKNLVEQDASSDR
ncbi:hypothetical protein NT6N_24620 [Oceaniferula spumae]|uniref:Uncharacterized protein n=1 Tax=Oceaniferula spumae TaxID=2979115 RepID=A0AAT9FN80_9BACT